MTFEQKEKMSAMDVNMVQGWSCKKYVWAAATRIAYITRHVEITELSEPSDASSHPILTSICAKQNVKDMFTSKATADLKFEQYTAFMVFFFIKLWSP